MTAKLRLRPAFGSAAVNIKKKTSRGRGAKRGDLISITVDNLHLSVDNTAGGVPKKMGPKGALLQQVVKTAMKVMITT
jgi:hypothetical protein